jgi:hypothetical protein
LRYDFDSNQLVYTKYAGDEETGEAWPTWFYSWHCLGWRYSCTCFLEFLLQVSPWICACLSSSCLTAYAFFSLGHKLMFLFQL